LSRIRYEKTAIHPICRLRKLLKEEEPYFRAWSSTQGCTGSWEDWRKQYRKLGNDGLAQAQKQVFGGQ
jgi:hypothetical protein